MLKHQGHARCASFVNAAAGPDNVVQYRLQEAVEAVLGAFLLPQRDLRSQRAQRQRPSFHLVRLLPLAFASWIQACACKYKTRSSDLSWWCISQAFPAMQACFIPLELSSPAPLLQAAVGGCVSAQAGSAHSGASHVRTPSAGGRTGTVRRLTGPRPAADSLPGSPASFRAPPSSVAETSVSPTSSISSFRQAFREDSNGEVVLLSSIA